jgi:hypothetical protein
MPEGPYIIAIAAGHKIKSHVMDVVTAYLNGGGFGWRSD